MIIIRDNTTLSVIVLLILVLVSTSSSPKKVWAVEADAEEEEYTTATALVSWLRSRKGFVSDNIEIRRIDDGDDDDDDDDSDGNNSRLGVFAIHDIQANELILDIPANAEISSSGEEEEDNEEWTLNCNTVRRLLHEIRLKEESEYYPYIQYLMEMNQQHDLPLPSKWSHEGKDLLVEILGTNAMGEQTFPPDGIADWITYEWYQDCDGSNDPLEESMALLVVQHQFVNNNHHNNNNGGASLIPIMDTIRHRNGKWFNTETVVSYEESSTRIKKSTTVHATRDIKAGEEIYTSHNMCRNCKQHRVNYGAFEILRDYGFVEEYPQRWIFEDNSLGFVIDEIHPHDQESSQYEILSWIFGKPSTEAIDFMDNELGRLENLQETFILQADQELLPNNEYHTILAFLKALIVALTTALKSLPHDDTCVYEGTCSLSMSRYEDLMVQTEGLPYDKAYTCDNQKVFEPFDNGQYVELETIQSKYQQINYFQDPLNKDTCFDLDNTVQICGSYRPHYHESVVHYTARFLDTIQRVLFVGGGDSMLLNEILKYTSSLELVVGLELDQKVTRAAFKHYGSQPHFDNDKVQWWYGDAAKSLLMLPRTYFGSFDMVLVDLSETVMSFQVTNKLDIMEALSLLLKPEGIFVKNEDYYEKLTNTFDNVVNIRWYDNPVICSQALALGSNTVDFMKRNQKDHGIDTLFIKPFDLLDDHYDLYHDYRKNESSVQLCSMNGEDDDDDDELEKQEEEDSTDHQERSPGILFILDAEEASELGNIQKSTSIDSLTNILVKSIESMGLSVLSTTIPSNEGTGTSHHDLTFALMVEGYIVARYFPDEKYVAFDILLWSSFEKHEPLKAALSTAFGSSSPSSSSFRIITGGMFGVSTWKDDEKQRGPQLNQKCHTADDESPSQANVDVESNTIDTILKSSMDLIPDNAKKIIVVCGHDIQNCNSVDILKTLDDVNNEVLPLGCPMLEDVNEYAENALQQMFECEKGLKDELLNFSKREKINSIIIDPGASFQVAQIVLRIFTRKRNASKLFDNLVVLSPILDPTTEIWKINLLRHFHEDVLIYEPAFCADVSFYGIENNNNANIVVASGGDDHFVQKLRNYMKDVQTKTGLKSETKELIGGLWLFQPDFIPTQFFLPGDYDQTSPLEQWSSQQPLGYQTIFQFESDMNNLSMSTLRDALESVLNEMAQYLLESNESISIEEFTNVGDGCVLTSLWFGGSAIVVWDGRRHVDINFFLHEENLSQVNNFEALFLTRIKYLVTVLRDDHPRGVGRVINFKSDLAQNSIPHWAP